MRCIQYRPSLPSMFNDWTIFDDFFNSNSLTHDTGKFDVKEFDDKIEIIGDIPGFNKDNIDIKCEKGYLTISGEVKKEKEEKDVKYLVKEIGSRSFYRKFYIGDSIDTEKINAQFKDGVLSIDLPKSEKERFRKIQIS